MLRISIQEDDNKVEVALAGRLAGPWVDELDRAWKQAAPAVAGKELSLDLRDLTYSDSQGLQVLKNIFRQTGAELVASSYWSQQLAAEIRQNNGSHETIGGTKHGNNA